jgi:hypothetical protein
MEYLIHIFLKIFHIKRHSGMSYKRKFLFFSLLLFIGLINLGIPDLKANVYPENSICKTYPVDIFNINFSNYRTFGIRENVPLNPDPKNNPENKEVPQTPSDQCYFKVGHRLIADKGPETAIIAFSGIYAGYPLLHVSFVSPAEFTWISLWNNNCFKIRPPPSC